MRLEEKTLSPATWSETLTHFRLPLISDGLVVINWPLVLHSEKVLDADEVFPEKSTDRRTRASPWRTKNRAFAGIGSWKMSHWSGWVHSAKHRQRTSTHFQLKENVWLRIVFDIKLNVQRYVLYNEYWAWIELTH